MLENIISTMSDEEIISKINELKKIDKNAINWKELLIVFVTNNFNVSADNLEVKFIEGDYKIVFTKMNITLEDLQVVISEVSADDEFYMASLKYIDNMSTIFKQVKITALENRLSMTEVPVEELKYHKKKRLNNTLNKLLIAATIIAVIYILVMLIGSFFVLE